MPRGDPGRLPPPRPPRARDHRPGSPQGCDSPPPPRDDEGCPDLDRRPPGRDRGGARCLGVAARRPGRRRPGRGLAGAGGTRRGLERRLPARCGATCAPATPRGPFVSPGLGRGNRRGFVFPFEFPFQALPPSASSRNPGRADALGVRRRDLVVEKQTRPDWAAGESPVRAASGNGAGAPTRPGHAREAGVTVGA